MYTIRAENRNTSLKAKQLRRSGIIPGCIYGSDLEKTLLIQIPQSDVKKLLKSKTKGGKVALEVDGKKIIALLWEISRSPLGNQIENLGFQSLVSDEMVTSTARIILLNKEKIPEFIQQTLFEISYKALPSNLVEQIEIDLEGMKVGSYVRVEDLEIAQNEDIELLTAPDSLVVSIIEQRRFANAVQEADTVDTADTADTAVTA